MLIVEAMANHLQRV